MSPAPGVISTISENIVADAIALDDTPFIVGLSLKGSVTEPTLITSESKVATYIGGRQSYSPVYDTFITSFREGPSDPVPHFFIRAVGPAAKSSSKKLKASSTDVLEVTATSPGEWGDQIKVAIAAGVTGGTFVITVLYEDVLKEKSPELVDNTAAVAWAASSAYVRLKVLAATDPDVAAAAALTGGTDDRVNVNASVIAAQIVKFGVDLGFGSIAAPGYTAEAVHLALLAHAEKTERVAVLDGVDTATEATLIGAAGALRSAAGHTRGAMFGPWDIIPGPTAGTTTVVPPCGRQLGTIARVARATGNPNQPAAGPEGKAQYVVGLSQSYSATQREALNDAGVNVSIIDEAKVTTFGWRTLANSVTERAWLPLSNVRQALSMASNARRILKRYMFAQLDGDGDTKGRAEGAIINEVHTPAKRNKAVYKSEVAVTQDTGPDDGSIGKLIASQKIWPTKFSEVIELTTSVSTETL